MEITKLTFDTVFAWCVQLLVHWAKVLGMTYEEINIWIFVIIQPIVFLIMCIWIFALYRRIRELKKKSWA